MVGCWGCGSRIPKRRVDEDVRPRRPHHNIASGMVVQAGRLHGLAPIDITNRPPGTRDACPTKETSAAKGRLWGSRLGCRVGGRPCQSVCHRRNRRNDALDDILHLSSQARPAGPGAP
jgi:hypothetical protein